MNILDYSLFDASICEERNLVATSEIIDIPRFPDHGQKAKCIVSLSKGTSRFIDRNVKFKEIVSEVVYSAGVSGNGFNTHEVRSKCIERHFSE